MVVMVSKDDSKSFSPGSSPGRATNYKIMECAIVLNGNDIIKVSNLKRKYNKILNNPNMRILEECSRNELDEKYNYWNRTLNRNIEEEEIAESKLYHFVNPKTKCSITSIYPDLEQCKSYIKDWNEYERCD